MWSLENRPANLASRLFLALERIESNALRKPVRTTTGSRRSSSSLWRLSYFVMNSTSTLNPQQVEHYREGILESNLILIGDLVATVASAAQPLSPP